MNYTIVEWTIKQLIDKYEEKKLDLKPPYQRNDIWSLPAKKRLINTIFLGFPLPAFFLHLKENGEYDMVDGQQRTRTILGYHKMLFPKTVAHKFDEIPDAKFLSYRLPMIIIENTSDIGLIQEFYYRVNKFGSKINRPETFKGYYHETPFQNLVERLSETESFVNLNLFTEAALNRMNDYDFIGELLSLIKFKITDKKEKVDKLYEEGNISETDIEELESKFNLVISQIEKLNIIYPLKNIRYKQRNDFYTLFSFLVYHPDINSETLTYFYKILVLIGDDISPSNEDCFAFQDYAINCVSQSNSKKARDARLHFFEDLLLNKYKNPQEKNENDEPINPILTDVLIFYFKGENRLKKIEDYFIVDFEALNSIKRLFPENGV